jgi:hypothetical protein
MCRHARACAPTKDPLLHAQTHSVLPWQLACIRCTKGLCSVTTAVQLVHRQLPTQPHISTAHTLQQTCMRSSAVPPRTHVSNSLPQPLTLPHPTITHAHMHGVSNPWQARLVPHIHVLTRIILPVEESPRLGNKRCTTDNPPTHAHVRHAAT